MKIKPQPTRSPKWSLSNENLIDNQGKSNPGQPGPQKDGHKHGRLAPAIQDPKMAAF